MDMNIKEQVAEIVCNYCFPYMCEPWGKPPGERMELCEPCKDGVNQIHSHYLAWFKEMGEREDL